MTKIFRYCILCAVAILCSNTLDVNALVINELMQSNIDCIMDDLYEYPDSWVELYNDNETVVNLKDYGIGISANPDESWQLPDFTLDPFSFYLVFCDKESKDNHTDFRLESGKGCNVYLFKNGLVEDVVNNLKKMPAPNVSYGRKYDADDVWGYQLEATPGQSNSGRISNEILGSPVFSVKGGLFTESVQVDVSLPVSAPEATVIRFTTDGSEPSEMSQVWSIPLDIDSTTVLRAKLFNENCLSPRSETQSYIFHPREVTLPVISLVTDSCHFYDERYGIYTEDNDAYNHRDWRRPVNFEMFVESSRTAVLNQLCETRVKGQMSRKEPLKSLVVYANKRFGTKRLDFDFFPDDTPGITDWKSIELRNSGNDFNRCYLRDGLLQRIGGRNLNVDYQPVQPAIIYINGEYKGILNIRSRANEDYVYSLYDGLENIDLIEVMNYVVKQGDRIALDKLLNLVDDTDKNYDDFEKVIDIDSYTDYCVLNFLMNNQDWPGNNAIMWRERADDAKWRWICKDMDYAAGNFAVDYDYPTFRWFYDPSFDSASNWACSENDTKLFRRLMKFDTFFSLFIDKVFVYVNDRLNSKHLIEYFEELRNEILFEMPYHRVKYLGEKDNWEYHLDYLDNWLAKRGEFFINHTAEYFGLDSLSSLAIDNSDSRIAISVNGVELHDSAFDGCFPSGRDLILENNGECDVYWVVTTLYPDTDATTKMVVKDNKLTLTLPEGHSTHVRASVSDSGVNDVISDYGNSADDSVYDLTGRKCNGNLLPGIYIRNGKKMIIK